jgi:hypothetical protein
MANNFVNRFRKPEVVRGRRREARVGALGAFCTEITDAGERYAIVSDLSAGGLRLHRPFASGLGRTVQLEFDLPGVDELIWAKGVVCFDSVWRAGEGQLLQTTGVELAGVAGRHLRLLREYAAAEASRLGPYGERRSHRLAAP